MTITLNNTNITFNDSTTQSTADNISYTGGSAGYYPARAIVSFDAVGGTPTITTNYNVSSIGDNGVGLFTINITTALPAATFSWMGNVQATTTNRVGMINGRTGVTAQTTSTLLISAYNSNANTPMDANYNSVTIFR